MEAIWEDRQKGGYMEEAQVLKKIKEDHVIAIIRGVEKKYIIPTVQALKDGGIKAVEITFDHTSPNGIEETAEKIRILRNTFKDEMNIGAGTVLSCKEVEIAAESGADYMISPDTNVAVIKRTKELGKVSIPGALTPSEICVAYSSGADIVKIFPAGNLGLGYIKSILAPLKHIPMCAVGGITPESMEQLRGIGIQYFGIGGKLISLAAVHSGDFQKITDTAKEYTSVLEKTVK